MISNKKLRFGTLSVTTLFVTVFLLVSALLISVGAAVISTVSGGESSNFGSGLLLAMVAIPGALVTFGVASVVTVIVSRRFRNKVMPENKSSSMALFGLSLLAPSWIVGILVWNNQVGNPAPAITLPAIVASILQIVTFLSLVFLGKSDDKTRQRVWGSLLNAVLFFIPFIVALVATR